MPLVRARMLVVVSVIWGLACVDRLPVTPSASEHAETLALGRAGERVAGPFLGSWNNSESPPAVEPPSGCTVYLQTTQTGRATQLGSFSGTGATCATSPLGPPVVAPPFWDHAPAPPYIVLDFTNEMTWVAGNGDELWLGPNAGVFVQSLANGAASVRGMLTISGGTGRFADASGSVAVAGGREPGEAGDHLEFQGEIAVCQGVGCQSPGGRP